MIPKVQAFEEKMDHLERQMSKYSKAMDKAEKVIEAKDREIWERKRRERILLIVILISNLLQIIFWPVLIMLAL